MASNAALSIPVQAGALKKGSHVVIKGFPCKIVDYSTSKTGKHGHAKAHIVALDIFTGKKYEDMSPTTHNMESPVVKRSEYQLINIEEDGYMSLMDADNAEKSDISLEEGNEIHDQIRAEFEDGKEVFVTIVSAMGTERAMAFKTTSAE